MKTAGFTAEFSLYKAGRHYRTDMDPLISSRRMDGLRLARAEEIEIFDCGPGFLKLGEGENTICIPDPSWSGDGGSGAPGGPFEDWPGGGGAGDGSSDKPDKPSRPPRSELMGRAWRKECLKEKTADEVFKCCDKKNDDCFRKANKNSQLELECVEASEWCFGRKW
jgi:hypothetical protein